MSTPKANGGNVQPWVPRHRTERGAPVQSFDLSSDDRAASVALGVCYGLLLAVVTACWAVIRFCS